MNAAIAELMPFADAMFWHGFTIFLRVGAIVALLPAFGEHSVPTRIKLGIILAFVMIVAPLVAPMPRPTAFGGFAWIVLTETVIGLLIGIGIRLFILALQTAGSIAAQSTSLSQLLGGAAADPLPAMGYFLVIGSLALAVMSGLHVKAAELMILSYDLLPMARLPEGADIAGWGLQQVSRAFTLAFTLAAPFVILSILYNLALGVINKAMPQLMVAFVGAPVITAGALLVLCLASPLILQTWIRALDTFLAAPFATPP